MKAPKCKICGHEHYGLCAGVVAETIVDALLPPAKPRAKPKVERKPQLQVIEGSPAEKIAKAREIIKEIEAKPTRRKAAKKSTAARKDALGKKEGTERTPAASKVTSPSAGDQAEPVAGTQAPPVDPPKPARKGNRHKPGYMAEYMRKRRADKKEQPK